MSKEDFVIRCPKCGAEYLPAEIFVDDLLGNPTNITKDENGKIEFYTGEPMSFVEEYECDICGCKFIIKGNVSFETEVKEDLADDYESVIYEGRISLWENK